MLVGVCGVSGSGKSTLLIDTLGRALAPKKQTTSVAYEPVEPGEHDAIEGAPARTVLVDQSRAGVHSPLSFLDLGRAAAGALRRERGCAGAGPRRGAARRALLGLRRARASSRWTWASCPTCTSPARPAAAPASCRRPGRCACAASRCRRLLGLTIDEVYDLFGDEPALARPLAGRARGGAGLPGAAPARLRPLRRRGAAAEDRPRAVPSAPAAGTLYILDEPTVGQHLEDVARLAGCCTGWWTPGTRCSWSSTTRTCWPPATG